MLRPLNDNKPGVPQPLVNVLTYISRLAILGVGVGTLTGTTLSVINPEQYSLSEINLLSDQSTTVSNESISPVSFPLGEELLQLEQKIQTLTAKYPQLEATAFLVDLDNYAYVNFNGDSPIAAASTIKIPILVAFLQDVDAGKIYLDEMLTMEKKHLASGSGQMQYSYGSGQKFSALEVATQMIITSDNSATNMLIDRLGGAEALNQRFREWGLKSTTINQDLPDLEGTNITSAEDLVFLLSQIDQGKLVSLRSRDRLLNIMTSTKNNSLIPQGVESKAIVAHKTGDIGSVLADAGIVDIPNGKRYLVAIMVKRPHNDLQARSIIQEISRTAYQHFKWYEPRRVTIPATP